MRHEQGVGLAGLRKTELVLCLHTSHALSLWQLKRTLPVPQQFLALCPGPEFTCTKWIPRNVRTQVSSDM